MGSRVFGSILLVFAMTAFFSATGMIDWYRLNEIAFVQTGVMVLLFSFAVWYLFK